VYTFPRFAAVHATGGIYCAAKVGELTNSQTAVLNDAVFQQRCIFLADMRDFNFK